MYLQIIFTNILIYIYKRSTLRQSCLTFGASQSQLNLGMNSGCWLVPAKSKAKLTSRSISRYIFNFSKPCWDETSMGVEGKIGVDIYPGEIGGRREDVECTLWSKLQFWFFSYSKIGYYIQYIWKVDHFEAHSRSALMDERRLATATTSDETFLLNKARASLRKVQDGDINPFNPDSDLNFVFIERFYRREV